MNEADVLLSEVEIGPYKIKPWSFGRFKKVFPVLIGMIPVLREMGVTAENIQEVLQERGVELVANLLSPIGALISATLDISAEDVEAMDFGQATVIGLTIISQNINRLKNFLPLVMAQILPVIRAT